MLEIRTCRDDADEQLSLEIYNRVFPDDALSVAEARAWKAAMIAAADYVALLDGEPVGSLAVARMPEKRDLGLLILTVLAERRGRGVGTALYGEGSRWLGGQGIAETEAIAAEDDARSLAWAASRGFREVQRNGRMVLELEGYDPPAPDPPKDIEITTWAERPDAIHGIYEVARESWTDIPGDEDFEIEPFEPWLAHHMQGPGDRPEATFVALAGHEVVGYAKLSLTAARPHVASHDLTAVKRAWRGRGVAGALKRAQIAWAKEQGFEKLATTNEMRNEPIRRLNERLGYRPAPGRVILRGPLAS